VFPDEKENQQRNQNLDLIPAALFQTFSTFKRSDISIQSEGMDINTSTSAPRMRCPGHAAFMQEQIKKRNREYAQKQQSGL
jgi:hypothetical protein